MYSLSVDTNSPPRAAAYVLVLVQMLRRLAPNGSRHRIEISRIGWEKVVPVLHDDTSA